MLGSSKPVAGPMHQRSVNAAVQVGNSCLRMTARQALRPSTTRRHLAPEFAHGRITVQVSASTTQLPYNATIEDDDRSCAPSIVKVDNTGSISRLDIDAPDFPDLRRTLAWVLNGMCLRVQHASMTTKDGWASDHYWVTTWLGNKLTEEQVALMRERVQDFVIYCEPRVANPTEWVTPSGLRVSNREHPDWTVLTVSGEPARQGFLLELTSVLNGTGARIQEAQIQGAALPDAEPGTGAGAPVPGAIAPSDNDFSKGRYFRFLLSDGNGAKLDASRIGSLLFIYHTFTEAKHMPLVAPSMETFLRESENGL